MVLVGWAENPGPAYQEVQRSEDRLALPALAHNPFLPRATLRQAPQELSLALCIGES